MGEVRGGGGFLAALLQLAAVGDEDGVERAIVLVDGHFGHGFEDVLPCHDVPEDGVFAVQVWAWGQGDEESALVVSVVNFRLCFYRARRRDAEELVGEYSLAAVRPFAPVCHTHQSVPVDLSPSDILVFELAAVDARAAGPVALRDVAALYHELVYDAVEGGLLVGQGLGGGGRRVGGRCEGAETVLECVSTEFLVAWWV